MLIGRRRRTFPVSSSACLLEIRAPPFPVKYGMVWYGMIPQQHQSDEDEAAVSECIWEELAPRLVWFGCFCCLLTCFLHAASYSTFETLSWQVSTHIASKHPKGRGEKNVKVVLLQRNEVGQTIILYYVQYSDTDNNRYFRYGFVLNTFQFVSKSYRRGQNRVIDLKREGESLRNASSKQLMLLQRDMKKAKHKLRLKLTLFRH